MYVWLEGQDVDCTNYASHGGGILVNVGLTKGEDEGSGEDTTKWVSPSEIFDQTGENEIGLHIGDFVNYDAGTWTQEEIDSTVFFQQADSPVGYRFESITVGRSKNANAKQMTSPDYTYIKDASTNSEVSGWRIFDIEGDNVTLISAGNVENYMHPAGYAYQTEYILTGNINKDWIDAESEKDNYQKRNWNIYANQAQKATEAIPLTKDRLDNWFTKYIGVENADTNDYNTFREIYEDQYKKYQNIIDNYSDYWVASAINANSLYYCSSSGYIGQSYYAIDFTFGIRLLISLSSDVLFSQKNIGTKTLTGGNMDTYGGNQTYNCWQIK